MSCWWPSVAINFYFLQLKTNTISARVISRCNRLVLWVSSKLTRRGSSCKDKRKQNCSDPPVYYIQENWSFTVTFEQKHLHAKLIYAEVHKKTDHFPTPNIEPMHPSGCHTLIRTVEWIKGVNKSACALHPPCPPAPVPVILLSFSGLRPFQQSSTAALPHRLCWCHCHYMSLVQREAQIRAAQTEAGRNSVKDIRRCVRRI